MSVTPLSVVIPNGILESIGKDEQEIKLELAVFFYKEFHLSSSKAAEFAGISRIAFWKELGKREIPLNYDEEDARHDVETMLEFNAKFAEL
ncbi:UPF0175 family protein [Haliscomenobacter hydrossis]|uniref:Uncharacterized protein n=1 Tax=Haliscomenobacter hydrossis (strain ATCC 27775 / DSM 1100 / LMG 10767 / O) TaxID=760192 RepID=F4KXH7_HALH1|nr:UPF0175 family protein [Haliscomenobacter hydrossis]AEE50348.1 protein of unknown function UPF0175 [Haliscomenobacter hydrossis DSM 1100]